MTAALVTVMPLGSPEHTGAQMSSHASHVSDSGATADLDSLLYQTQGGTHEPSESVKWRRDPLQALSHAGIGSLERRAKKEGV